jgi:hypothetical protein
MHASARDGEGYGGGVAVRRGKTLAYFDVFLVEAVGIGKPTAIPLLHEQGETKLAAHPLVYMGY